MSSHYTVSTPNVFKHLIGDTISRTFKAKNKEKATDKFYEWISHEYNYDPEIVAVKKVKDGTGK